MHYWKARPGPEERILKSWSKESPSRHSRDLDIVPDDPDPVDLAVALLPRFGKHVSWNVLSSRLASEWRERDR